MALLLRQLTLAPARRLMFALFLFSFLLFTGQLAAPAQTASPANPARVSPSLLATNTPANPYRPDRILIKPKPATTPAALANFHSARHGKVLRAFPRMGGLQIVTVPAGETVASFITRYAQSGLVEFAEPDYEFHISTTTPNDPKYLDGTLWGLNNFGQSGGTPHADIDAPEGWDVLTSASNIVVAVLDTGVWYTHEDLAANMWVNTNDGSHGLNAVATNNNPLDDNGHGTLVAGVLGASGNNGKGVVGVAWQVQIMACKCLNSGGSGNESDIITCIDYAITNGAKVMNASFDAPTASLAFSNAIVSAQQAGIIFVASCGNAGANVDLSPTYPACYHIDNVVSVGALTRTNTMAGFSNFGATNVHLVAPGTNMYSTFFGSDSAYLGGSFLYGTSLSAPYVTGTFALMLAKYPAENYQSLISRVLKGTDPVPDLAGKCSTGGRLNLRKALSPPILLTALPTPPGAPFQLHLDAGPNRTCVILVTKNLASWTPIYTNTTSAAGTFDFTDPASTNSEARYYRAQSTL
jgi:subtilisin family serine protease